VNVLLIGLPGGTELIIILVIVVMFFGLGKLPQVGKQLGEGIKNFKKEVSDDSDDEPLLTDEEEVADAPRDVTHEKVSET
jgi:sec-independent protein translocase protein TatA